MTPINLGSYKSIYIKTAKEYVDKISASLDELSSDVSNKKALNNLHISSHSLKSQSQVMGLTDIANICLNIEQVSSDALQGNTQLNNETVLDFKKKVEELDGILRFAQDDSGIKA